MTDSLAERLRYASDRVGMGKHAANLDGLLDEAADRIAAMEAGAGGVDAATALGAYVRICVREHDENSTREDRIAAMQRALAATPKASGAEDIEIAAYKRGFTDCQRMTQADPAPPVACEVADGLDRIAGGALEHEADELLVKLAAYMIRDHARMVAAKDAAEREAFQKYVDANEARIEAGQRIEAMAALLWEAHYAVKYRRSCTTDPADCDGKLLARIDAALRDGLAAQEGAG